MEFDAFKKKTKRKNNKERKNKIHAMENNNMDRINCLKKFATIFFLFFKFKLKQYQVASNEDMLMSWKTISINKTSNEFIS